MANDTATTASDTKIATMSTSNVVLNFIISTIVGIVMLVMLLRAADLWHVLAATRILDPLIEGGVIRYHALNPGFFAGIQSPHHYFMAMDPIDWRLVLLALFLYSAYVVLKGTQFHAIARAYGLEGTFGENLRAYLYGDGLDRFLPFHMGAVAIASAVGKRGGADAQKRAASAVFVTHAFTVFEFSTFAFIGLWMLGWTTWLGEILWALVILGVAYYIVHPARGRGRMSYASESLRSGMQGFRWLAQWDFGVFVRLCALSLVAFLLLDMAVYMTMTAYDTNNVLISVPTPMLIMGVVGGYIARQIQVTPGGIGQFEVGFAAGLYVGDLPWVAHNAPNLFYDLVVIAVLVQFFIFIAGMILLAIARSGSGVPTNLRETFALFTLAEPRTAE